MAGKSKSKKKIGRPKKKIDLDIVRKLGALHCTDEELSAYLDVSIDTIKRRKKEDDFSTAYEKGKGQGKLSLRRLLWLHAQKHHGAAIFLSKNILGYRDNIETTQHIKFEDMDNDKLNAESAEIMRQDGWISIAPDDPAHARHKELLE